MLKLLSFLFLALILLFYTNVCFANENSFVSIVNPVRGGDFWDLKNQEPQTAFLGELEILKQFNINVTWLIRYDGLSNEKIINILTTLPTHEKGLFLEVTPSWTKDAAVNYHQSQNWHWAGSAFLTGYETSEREKLIDTAFEKFKEIFGYYPVSVGAWWIDSYSLEYMQKKYNIKASLIVSDQYSTDNYQIWGQYLSIPYYPTKRNALNPAQSLENKIPIVMMQWAARDPINSYGNGVEQSTFSVQPNDYIDYHNLDIKYFSSLVDLYTKSDFNKFNHLVMGLENSYPWDKYKEEYLNQIKTLANKGNVNQFTIITMEGFASWYQKNFPGLSPSQIIVADDPLGSFKKAVWFMNPYYRAGWFYNQNGSVFRDIRPFTNGEEEICFNKRCDSVNFATTATRVLDEVSFGHKLVVDEGKISNFKVSGEEDKFLISYNNEAGKQRKIEFLPRDISIDGRISSIDETILNATKLDLEKQNTIKSLIEKGSFKWSLVSILSKIIKFILFLVIGCIIPGLVLLRNLSERNFAHRLFLSTIIGLVSLTIIFYLASLLNLRSLVFIYFPINIFLLIYLRLYFINITIPKLRGFNIILTFTILIGTIFQVIPTFKNGLLFPYGLGLWGPNTHDGIWHISLINQLTKSVPPQNPIFSQNSLKNYHFFYDLLVAATNYFTQIPILDLVFRFYPILFSLSLGLGSYYLVKNFFQEKEITLKNKMAILVSLYLVYFAGSFGWIVSFIKERKFAGESAFWANQSISFNLNPPFAISLIIIIAFLIILFKKSNKQIIFLEIILAGALIGFKAYGAILILFTLFIVGILKKQLSYLVIFMGASIISALIFFANFQSNTKLLVFAPFWFIHSMIDSPDRVGWVRLSLAREVGFTQKNWFKFISAEFLSLLIFILGNLGLRFFSLLSIIKVKKIFKETNSLFIFIFSAVSILIPILFIQSGNPWNTIQFSYYCLYIAAIVSGLVLSMLIFNLPKFLQFLIIIMILILAPINSIVTASYYTNYQPHAKISREELEALEFLSKQADGVVLTYPYNEKMKQKIAEPWPLYVYDSTAYVAAFSKKGVYIEDEAQNQILLTEYKKRLVASKDFFSIQGSNGQNFLQQNKIKYIYLPKLFNIGIDQMSLKVKNIFENNEVIIYKVENVN